MRRILSLSLPKALAGVVSLLVAGLVTAGAAQAASGTITITNGTADAKAMYSFSEVDTYTNPIDPYSSGEVKTVNFPDKTVKVGDFTYRSGSIVTGGTKGCYFRWYTSINSLSQCNVTITTQSSGSVPSTCSASVQTVNTSTCTFTASGTIN